MVVPVDALELDGHAVDAHLTVDDLDRPEPDAAALDVDDRAVFVLQDEHERVEIRRLGGPLLRGLHRDAALRAGAFRRHRAVGVIQRRPDGVARVGFAGRVPERRADMQHGVGVIAIEVGRHDEVGNANRRLAVENHVAVDAAQAPRVLVFEVGAVAVAQHTNGDRVLAGPDVPRDLELGREPAALAVADFDAVDPQVQRGIDALEREKYPAAGPFVRDRERAPIAARLVLLGHEGRVRLERPADILVDRLPVAAQLPVARHVDLVPAARVEVLGEEVVRSAFDRLGEAELPRPVERLHVWRARPVASERRFDVGICAERHVRRELASLGDGGIFPLAPFRVERRHAMGYARIR